MKTEKSIPIVVTRHPGFVDLAIERGLIDATAPVVAHASPDAIQGRTVVTSGLPLHLAALCSEVITIPLNLPAELRGIELDINQCREYAAPTAIFVVREVSK